MEEEDAHDGCLLFREPTTRVAANHANGCGDSVPFRLNGDMQIDLTVACFFMLSNGSE